MRFLPSSFFIVFLLSIFLFNNISVLGDNNFEVLIKNRKFKEAIEYSENNIPVSKRTVDIWLKLADAYSKTEGSEEEILLCFENAKKVNPNDSRIFIGFGKTYLKSKKYDFALKNFQRGYILKRSAEAAEGIAISSAKLSHWEKARDAAESAINLDPDTYESRVILAEIFYTHEKDYSLAADQLETIVQKKPSILKFWKMLASCYEKLNNKEKLAIIDPEIIKRDKKNVKARKRHALYSLSKNDTNTAYIIYKELALITPKDPDVFKKLYQLSKEKGSSRDAITYLKNYIELDSTHAESHKELGNLLYKEKDFDLALKSYRRALAIDKNIKGFFKNYEFIVLSKNLKKEAIFVINAAINNGEADAASYIAIADLHKEHKKYGEAIRMYKIALKTEIQNIKVLSSLAECQAKSNDINNAVITYEQVVLLNPDATYEYKILGDLHYSLKRKKNAIAAYKKYIAKKPSDYHVAKTIGLYEYQNKQYESAIDFLEMVKNNELRDIDFLYSLGQCYYITKNYKKAAELFSKVYNKKAPESVLITILKPLGISYEKINKKIEAAKAYETYITLTGAVDPDASYLTAFLREERDKATAVEIYKKNITQFANDYRNYLRLGMIYSENSTTLSKSAEMLSKASVLVPDNAEIFRKLGEVNGKLKKTDQQMNAYMRLLSLQPQDFKANRRVGVILTGKKRYSEAIINLEMVLTAKPNDIEIIEMLADCYFKTKRPDRSVDLLVKAKKIKPQSLRIRKKLIEACKSSGDTSLYSKERQGLIELDQKIVKSDTKNIDSRIRLAEYTFEKEDYATAYNLYTELSKLTPKNQIVFERLYIISLKNNKKKDATHYLQAFLKIDKKNAKYFGILGNLLFEQKDYNDALAAYRLALKNDPNIKGFYQNYSNILVDKGLDDEAISALNAAIKANEADINTYITLGKLYNKRKKYNAAIIMFKKASDSDPKNHTTLTLLGESQAKNGDINDAILTYEQVVLINPGAKYEYMELGNLQLKANKKESAIRTFKKYLSLVPNNSKIAHTIGMHEFGKKNYQEVIKYLEKVSDKKFYDTKYYKTLGHSYYHTKNYKKASEYYTIVSKRKVSNNVLLEILKPLGESLENTGKNLDAANAYLTFTKLPGAKDADASYKKAFLREKVDPSTAQKMYATNVTEFNNDYRNFYRLGMLYSKNESGLKKAVKMFNTALMLNPKEKDILQNLGEVHGKLKNRKNELITYQRLLKLDPRDETANRRVGLILLNNKKYSKAILNLEIVMTHTPDDVEIMLSLAKAYMETKRHQNAISLLNKVKNSTEHAVYVRDLLYKLYKQTNNKKRAEEEIIKLIELTGDNKYTFLYIRDLVDKKKYKKALNLVQEIKSKDPVNVTCLMFLGEIQQAQNKLDEAIETYKMISYMRDNYAPALCERGTIYLKQSKLKRAASFFLRCVKIDPKNVKAYYGLAKIAKLQKNNSLYYDYINKVKSLDSNYPEVMGN